MGPWCCFLSGVASSLAGLIPDPEASSIIDSLTIAAEQFRDPQTLMGHLERLLSLGPREQRLCGSAFHAASHVGDLPAEDVWRLATVGDWLRRCVAELPNLVLSDLLEGLSALQGRVGGDWEWGLPQLFARVAESPNLDSERRNLMATMTIIVSANAGTVGACRRLIKGEQRAAFRHELTRLRERLERALSIAPPWAAARFRDLLSCLHYP